MFYDRFLELCSEKGVRPTNACIEAGLSRGLAAKWKSTKTEKPSADALEKMSIYFQKTIDEILKFNTEKKSPAPVSKSGRSVNIVKIAGRDGRFVEKRLSDDQIKALKTIIEQLPDASDVL